MSGHGHRMFGRVSELVPQPGQEQGTPRHGPGNIQTHISGKGSRQYPVLIDFLATKRTF